MIARILAKDSKVDAPPDPEPPLDHLEEMRRRALEDEKAGRGTVMRNPGIKPKPPRKPSWES